MRHSNNGHVCAICVGNCYCYDSFFLRNQIYYSSFAYSKPPRLTPYVSLENKSTVLHGPDMGCPPCSSDHDQNNLKARDKDEENNQTGQEWFTCENVSKRSKDDTDDFERRSFEDSKEGETIATNVKAITHQLMQDPVRAQDFECLLHAPTFLKSAKYLVDNSDINESPWIISSNAAIKSRLTTSSFSDKGSSIAEERHRKLVSEYIPSFTLKPKITKRAAKCKSWDAIDEALSGI